MLPYRTGPSSPLPFNRGSFPFMGIQPPHVPIAPNFFQSQAMPAQGGLLSRFLGGLSQGGIPTSTGGGLQGLLGNAQKVMKVAQTVGPMVKQYGPMVKNAPAMFRLYKELMNSNNENINSLSNNVDIEEKDPGTLVSNNENDNQIKRKGDSVPKLYI